MAALFLTAGCSTEGGSSGSSGPTTVILKANEGILFETGEIVEGFPPFSKSDLYVIEGGTNNSLQLDTGKAKSTDPSSPVNWYIVNNKPLTWDSLELVPNTVPNDSMTTKLLGAEQGVGFIAKNYLSAGYTKGWVKEATADTLTIVYEPFEGAQ